MGGFLQKPITTKNCEEGENERIRFAAGDMQGWRYRQEDSHITSMNIGPNKDIELFGVFDGHGGSEVAQWVKVHFVEELEANTNFQKGNYKEALEETFLKMDELLVTPANKEELKKLHKKSKELDNLQNANTNANNQMNLLNQILMDRNEAQADIANQVGCTAVVTLITQDTIYFANAGDSRVVISKNGKAYPMSIDHKPENDAEKARIYKANGWITEGRINGNLNLSRSLGDLEYKVPKNFHPKEYIITAFPEVTSTKITKDLDFIFMGCDGIWDCKTDQEAIDFASKRLEDKKYTKMSKILEELFDDCVAEDIYNGRFLIRARNWVR